MAHDEGNVDRGIAETLDCKGALLRRNAKARHAGIELQRGGQIATKSLGRLGPGVDLLERIEHGDNAGFCANAFATRQQAIEHIESGIFCQMRAQDQRLAEMGHEEIAAAFIKESLCNLLGPEPIGIGLDHRAHGAAGNLAQTGVIGADRTKIDSQHARRGNGIGARGSGIIIKHGCPLRH
jgi:hypothetical protein